MHLQDTFKDLTYSVYLDSTCNHRHNSSVYRSIKSYNLVFSLAISFSPHILFTLNTCGLRLIFLYKQLFLLRHSIHTSV